MIILCYGDSNTFGYDPRSFLGDRYDTPWPEGVGELTGWKLRNSGLCGRRVPLRDMVFPKSADLILVMLGTNDLLCGEHPQSIADRMEQFLSAQDPARCILIAPPPLCWGEWVTDDDLVQSSQALAGEYRGICARLGVRFLDAGQWSIPLCYDGVHFTEEGHRLFAARMAQALQNACCNLSGSGI
jgi:lysophospholipase L1-like esterase